MRTFLSSILNSLFKNDFFHKTYRRIGIVSGTYDGHLQCSQVFKDYLLKNDMEKILSNLKRGLDEVSKECVDTAVQRLMLFPPNKLKGSQLFEREKYLTQEEKNLQDIPSIELRKIEELCGVTIPSHSVVLYSHFGLKFLNDASIEYMRDKDFIDAGAWIGDSAIIFQKHYSPRKVYSFDISKDNFQKYEKNMHRNNIPTSKYEQIPKALGGEDKKIHISLADDETPSHMLNIYSEGDLELEQITIDSFVEDTELNVGLIKADIEGAELDMIKGAKKTICNQKPILAISIYHKPEHYFELKSLLDSWKIGYRFMIRQTLPLNIDETMLLAFPEL